MSTTDFVFQEASSEGLLAPAATGVDWIWQGYLARGRVTLLTSRWKAGKTTLVSILLARLAEGGQLAGLPVAKSSAAIVSEEGLENWRRRCGHLALRGKVAFLCRPFAAAPTQEAWQALVDHLARLGQEEGIELVVIDSLAQFLPGPIDKSSWAILDALRPLERLTAAGQAVLLVHHPRKRPSPDGQSARGTAALSTSVDVLIEMKLPPSSQPQDRRRRLLAWSRYEATPRERVIELAPDGRDYRLAELDTNDDQAAECWFVIERLLSSPPRQLTRAQLLALWPREVPAPPPNRLWRLLTRAVKLGTLAQEGTGRRNDPLRYFLPG
jgi:hypothetical protein